MKHMCPCCGFQGLRAPAYERLTSNVLIRGASPPYSAVWGMPSYEVCCCCGFEFGNDDEPGTSEPISFEQSLAQWKQNGEQWFDVKKRSPGWTLTEQLSKAERNQATPD